MLESFSAEEFENTAEQQPPMISFSDMLKKFQKKGSSTND